MRNNNSQYYHKNAGWVSKIRGVIFDSVGNGKVGEIQLYRLGETIHQLTDDSPGGEVTISETTREIKGWGISDPVTVTTASGNRIVASKAEVENIQRQ